MFQVCQVLMKWDRIKVCRVLQALTILACLHACLTDIVHVLLQRLLEVAFTDATWMQTSGECSHKFNVSQLPPASEAICKHNHTWPGEKGKITLLLNHLLVPCCCCNLWETSFKYVHWFTHLVMWYSFTHLVMWYRFTHLVMWYSFQSLTRDLQDPEQLLSKWPNQ